MITVEHNGWRVTRQIGIGDRENVRAGLMQIALFSQVALEAQVNGALEAALREGRTFRGYSNGDRLQLTDSTLAFRLQHVTMKRARDHDLLLLSDRPTAFNYAMERVDLYVEPLSATASATDLTYALRKIWQLSGRGRLNLPGISRTSYNEARQKFPEHVIDLAAAWKLYSEGR